MDGLTAHLGDECIKVGLKGSLDRVKSGGFEAVHELLVCCVEILGSANGQLLVKFGHDTGKGGILRLEVGFLGETVAKRDVWLGLGLRKLEQFMFVYRLVAAQPVDVNGTKGPRQCG